MKVTCNWAKLSIGEAWRYPRILHLNDYAVEARRIGIWSENQHTLLITQTPPEHLKSLSRRPFYCIIGYLGLKLWFLWNVKQKIGNARITKAHTIAIVCHFITRSFRPCTIYITRLDLVSPWVVVEVMFTIVCHFFHNIIRSNTLNLRHEAPASLIPTTPCP
jgi:hypothetical protein